MRITSFEEIIGWQKSKELTLGVYEATDKLRDLSFKDQIRRAAVSIMNNIAEGFERQSNRDFRKFLFIAKGSCGEVRSMARLGESLGYFNKKDSGDITANTIEISKILSGLIKSL